MENIKKKENPISKTWKRIKSLSSTNKKLSSTSSSLMKSKSWSSTITQKEISNNININGKPKKKNHMSGCFSVYVGSNKQRFAVKTELVNHPLFQILLEDAEMEYGYRNEGPIELPCEVDLFVKVLAQIQSCYDNEDDEEGYGEVLISPCSPLFLFSPSVKKGYGSYKLLPSSRMSNLN